MKNYYPVWEYVIESIGLVQLGWDSDVHIEGLTLMRRMAFLDRMMAKVMELLGLVEVELGVVINGGIDGAMAHNGD
jgi:hypothetical protein